ncbi:hypothetical protein ACFE04_013656 [Oxalis oulophora]
MTSSRSKTKNGKQNSGRRTQQVTSSGDGTRSGSTVTWQTRIMSVAPATFAKLPLMNNYVGGLESQSNYKLTKLLVKVTVERSLGPVQLVVAPEKTVKELIKSVVEIYVKEKRRPLLKETDPINFQLHYSPFSFECLEGDEKLMNLGSRNFFLWSKPSTTLNSSCLEQAKMETKFTFTKLMDFFATSKICQAYMIMAVSLSSSLYQPSLSCRSKQYSGLKLQSPGSIGNVKSNLNAQFFNTVHRSVQCGALSYKPVQGKFRMMPIGTPEVPYRTPGEGTWQWVDLYNALYRERVIFIGQNIDEEFSNQILGTMLFLDSIDDSKRVFMYINGPGGDLTPSLAIYDTMQSLASPVTTHCVGYAYHLAAFLVAAGEKAALKFYILMKLSRLGNRLAMPLSRMAIQTPAGSARGQADDIINEANELVRIKTYLWNELSKKTGQPVDKINKDFSRLKRFSADEALEYGLIDRIVRPPRIKEDTPRRDETAGLG